MPISRQNVTESGRYVLGQMKYVPLLHLWMSRFSDPMDTAYQEWNDPWSMDRTLLLDQWDNQPDGLVQRVVLYILGMPEAERDDQLEYLKRRESIIRHLMLLRDSEEHLFWAGTKYQTPTSRKEYIEMSQHKRRETWKQINDDWVDLKDATALVQAWGRFASSRQVPFSRQEYIQMGQDKRRVEWDRMKNMEALQRPPLRGSPLTDLPDMPAFQSKPVSPLPEVTRERVQLFEQMNDFGMNIRDDAY